MRQANISTVTVVAWRRHGVGVVLCGGAVVVTISASDNKSYVSLSHARMSSDYHVDKVLTPQ
jgi:hypothetical protein